MNSSFGQSNEPRLEDALLFDANLQTLAETNLTQHVCRLEVPQNLSKQMSRFLTDAINKNRLNLAELRDVVKGQISTLQSSSHVLQSHTRDQVERLRSIFQPAIAFESKKINEMKNEMTKITAEQLATKKSMLQLDAAINHCETDIGFKEISN